MYINFNDKNFKIFICSQPHPAPPQECTSIESRTDYSHICSPLSLGLLS